VKNILVIDAAQNCSFSVCAVEDDDFAILFPALGQDIEFTDDLTARIGEVEAGRVVLRSTTRRIRKKDAIGIHGTLFFGFAERRKHFPNKREARLFDWK
jgi:hypothetical protein